MLTFLGVLLRGVIATFVGLLIAGGTLTLAADRAPIERPSLVPVAPGPTTLDVPDVTGQAYVFAKGILQDHGFAWHVSGLVQGYAANTVVTQNPIPGTTVVDTGAPTIVLTLQRNPSYIERGTPENDAPYPGTAISLPANVRQRPTTLTKPQLEPVPVPTQQTAPTAPTTLAPPTQQTAPTVPTAAPTSPTVPSAPTPVQTAPTLPTTSPTLPTTTPTTPVQIPRPTNVPLTPTNTTPTRPVTPVTRAPVATTPRATTPTPAPTVSSGPRTPDFTVTGAPKEPAHSVSLPDRVAALGAWLGTHQQPTATNLNHWLYEHAYVVAGARFGWWHGAAALQALIDVDKRAEAQWGVGSQSRTTAEKALAEVRTRSS